VCPPITAHPPSASPAARPSPSSPCADSPVNVRFVDGVRRGVAGRRWNLARCGVLRGRSEAGAGGRRLLTSADPT
jgi:hypothetical protein